MNHITFRTIEMINGNSEHNKKLTMLKKSYSKYISHFVDVFISSIKLIKGHTD